MHVPFTGEQLSNYFSQSKRNESMTETKGSLCVYDDDAKE